MLSIVDVSAGKNRLGIQWLNISWLSDTGMGECVFFKENNKWKVVSEGMSKEFCSKLLELWMESCSII